MIKKAQFATRVIFLLCGFSLSAWAPMVPIVKDRLNLGEADLGFLLLFLGAGALLMMPVSGWLISAKGSRIVILLAAIFIALSLPLLLLMPGFISTAFVLFVFGAAIGAIDVAMNSAGANIQNQLTRPIMSSLHGLFSVGGLFGPLVIGLLLKVGLAPHYSAIFISVILLTLVFSQYGSLLTFTFEKSIQEAPAVHASVGSGWFNGTVLFLGAMCFIVFLSEGAILDWGAIFLRDEKGMDEAYSGIGYAVFSVSMAIMRLTGDRIVSTAGSSAIVRGGSMVAFIGMLVVVFAPTPVLSLIGFSLLGLGAANIVPVFFSEGGSLRNAAAIPAITTMGYAGQLAGPALLGFIAQVTSLKIAFGFTAFLLFLVFVAYLVRHKKS
jgi:MFS family permease